jgi:superfamily I DNA/RNA helicase
VTAPNTTSLSWVASANRHELEAAGWTVIDFGWLRQNVVPSTQRVDGGRDSLINPTQPWLQKVGSTQRLAVVGVRLESLSDVATLHGYVLEPAFRWRTAVLVESEQRLSRLPPDRFVDAGFEYAYTLERALDVATRLYRGVQAPRPPQSVAPPTVGLDPEQRRAVDAHDGVVQVIAPAGSGKTTVLIERVRELLRRGTPPAQILCTTFNRDARIELQERLARAGLSAVEARTFHSLGLWLLTEEKLARRGGTRPLSLNQWKRLCAIAGREDGVWIDAADARSKIGDIKLGLLCTPAEFRQRASDHPDGQTLARIYELYEQQLAEQELNDFDDHVLLSVRALREDADLRRRWQGRFSQVLVDEYQDIEPAQELLVRILAAPEDGFFCVGDEDQTLYGWRRASVRRMIDLDLAYPGLERVSLAHNYRCPPEVVTASRRLIEHNTVRFPKPIHPAPDRPPGGEDALQLREEQGQPQAADRIVRVLASHGRGEIVVLARTTNLLRTVALAAVEVGVRISAPPAVFEPRGARQALEAYLRLCARRDHPRPDDVALVCRAPNRGLPFEAETQVASLLRDGFTFVESFAGLQANARQRSKLDDAGRILDALVGMSDAPRFIRYLRGPGGLDEYFAEYEEAFGDTEQVELEVLEQAQHEAAGKTVAEYSALLDARTDALRGIRDDENGIELTTIHRAKGRQWPRVELFACEENQLPHRHALAATEEEKAAGEGVEAERRLAYVAFTRAQQTLVVSTSDGAASRFLTEAGLAPKRPYPPPASKTARSPGRQGAASTSPRARRPDRHRKPGAEFGPANAGLAEARRVGLGYALRTAASRTAALETAAAALEQRMIGPITTSERMTVAKLLAAIEAISDADRAALLTAAGISNDRVLLARLDVAARRRLVAALRDLA